MITIIKLISFFKKIRYINVATVDKTAVLYSTCRILNASRKKELIVVRKNSHIRGELFIFGHGGKIEIGDCCYIGEYSKIWSASSIKIGNRVLIAHNVNIHDNNSHPIDSVLRHKHFTDIITKGHPKNNINLDEKPITIQDDAWIGFNCTILKGVTVGTCSIVAACSVVTKDVPPYTIVAGNPARIIKTINKID